MGTIWRAMLTIEDLWVSYGGATVLRGVNLSVGTGEVVALLGRNGAGKTTLVRAIMGFTPPNVSKGDIIFDDIGLVGKSPDQIARCGVGLVPQGRRVFSSLTVSDNLTVCRRSSVDRWSFDEVFELFPILRERRHQSAGTLSGGEQQMLAIARALINGCQLLVLDEPSEGLAPSLIRKIESQMMSVRRARQSALLVEQNLRLALNLADRVCILDQGRVVFDDKPDALNRETIDAHLAI